MVDGSWIPIAINVFLNFLLFLYTWGMTRKHNLSRKNRALKTLAYWGVYKYIFLHSFDMFSDIAVIINLLGTPNKSDDWGDAPSFVDFFFLKIILKYLHKQTHIQTTKHNNNWL